VLDVKSGAGAFIPSLDRAITLARTMIALGQRYGCETVTLITDMDQPLGVACGNAIEVLESIEVLKGGGPEDLREVTFALGEEMLLVAKVERTRAAARARLERTISSGAALAKFQEIVVAQGGPAGFVDAPERHLAAAPVRVVFEAARGGVVQRVEPRVIGRAITALGGGRTKVEDTIDASVGFLVHTRPGATVRAGDPLVTILARDAAGAETARDALTRAISVGDAPPVRRPLVSHRVTAGGVEELAVAGAS